jgi:hypothetical protein
MGFVRRADITLEATFTDAGGAEIFRAVQSQREIRMTLRPDQRWPDVVRRGQSVDLEMNLGDTLYRLTGRVRFRRLNVAVILGQMERVSVARMAP